MESSFSHTHGQHTDGPCERRQRRHTKLLRIPKILIGIRARNCAETLRNLTQQHSRRYPPNTDTAHTHRSVSICILWRALSRIRTINKRILRAQDATKSAPSCCEYRRSCLALCWATSSRCKSCKWGVSRGASGTWAVMHWSLLPRSPPVYQVTPEHCAQNRIYTRDVQEISSPPFHTQLARINSTLIVTAAKLYSAKKKVCSVSTLFIGMNVLGFKVKGKQLSRKTWSAATKAVIIRREVRKVRMSEKARKEPNVVFVKLVKVERILNSLAGESCEVQGLSTAASRSEMSRKTARQACHYITYCMSWFVSEPLERALEFSWVPFTWPSVDTHFLSLSLLYKLYRYYSRKIIFATYLPVLETVRTHVGNAWNTSQNNWSQNLIKYCTSLTRSWVPFS